MYSASISLHIDGGKSTFDIKVTALSHSDAKTKLKTMYPNGVINHIRLESLADDAQIQTAVANKQRSEAKSIAVQTITKCVDDFGNAINIMRKLGGDISADDETFVWFDRDTFPKACESIRCMTRNLVKLGRVEQHGRVTVIYFEMK